MFSPNSTLMPYCTTTPDCFRCETASHYAFLYLFPPCLYLKTLYSLTLCTAPYWCNLKNLNNHSPADDLSANLGLTTQWVRGDWLVSLNALKTKLIMFPHYWADVIPDERFTKKKSLLALNVFWDSIPIQTLSGTRISILSQKMLIEWPVPCTNLKTYWLLLPSAIFTRDRSNQEWSIAVIRGLVLLSLTVHAHARTHFKICYIYERRVLSVGLF